MNTKEWSEYNLPQELAESLLKEINADIDGKSINAVKKAFYEFLTQYSLYHFSNEEHRLCGLCGNTGELDTSSTAVSPRGLKPGGKYPCFCPLGRVSRDDKYDTIKSPFVLHYKKDDKDSQNQ